jgi:hypothetical protein
MKWLMIRRIIRAAASALLPARDTSAAALFCMVGVTLGVNQRWTILFGRGKDTRGAN